MLHIQVNLLEIC